MKPTSLKDITVSCDRTHSRYREFNLRSACVSSMFLRQLGKYTTHPFKKVIIEVSDALDCRVENLVDVVRLTVRFDFEGYWTSEDPKRIILELIRDSLLELANMYGWETAPIECSYRRILERNIDYYFDVGEPISSPNRQKKAQIRCYHDMVKASIVARVEAEDGVQEFHLVDTLPHELKYVPYLGKIRWLDNETLILRPKDSNREDIVVRV